MATLSVALARDMAARYAHRAVGYVAAPVMAARYAHRAVGYVAAPVLGRPDMAAVGKLEILAAGTPDQIARVHMLLNLIGHKTWHFGDQPEQANAAKLGANFMIASAMEAMGEAALLVEGYEVSSRSFLEMITSTLFLGPVHAGYGRMIADQQYELAFAPVEGAGRCGSVPA